MGDYHPPGQPEREWLSYRQRARLDALSAPRPWRWVLYLGWLPSVMPLATGLPLLLAELVLAALSVVGLVYLVFFALPAWHMGWALWGCGGGAAGALVHAIVRDACACGPSAGVPETHTGREEERP